MSELHKFLFDGQPVRGAIVRLTDAWTDILRRRKDNTSSAQYPESVMQLLGEMAAAGVLMQSGINRTYANPIGTDGLRSSCRK